MELMTKEMQENIYNTPFRLAIRKAWKKKRDKIHELTKQIEDNCWVLGSNYGNKTADEYFLAKNTLELCEEERDRLEAEAMGLSMAMYICMEVVDELMKGENNTTKMIKKFSLYIDGEVVSVPEKPTCDGDLIYYKKDMDIRIGETVPGKELTWIPFIDASGQEAWMCDRCLINYISRDDCESLIGAKINVDGIPAVLELPSVGRSREDDCDWTRALKVIGYDESQLLWWQIFSLGKEVWEGSNTKWVAIRGYYHSNKWSYGHSGYGCYITGWRPVLRFPDTGNK